jgi:hypothetical protein
MSELKKYQRVKIQRERGTQDEAIVLGITGTGRILVQVGGVAVDAAHAVEIVDREDIQS